MMIPNSKQHTIQTPRILHLSTYDEFGGAARAASSILHAQINNGIDASMMTLVKTGHCKSVFQPTQQLLKNRLKLVADILNYNRNYSLLSNKGMQTFGDISAGIIDEINAHESEIVHLHWISFMLSIEDIAKIQKPIVWTLHDMWPFCGSEHYMGTDNEYFFRSEAVKKEIGTDRNDDTWQLKMQLWKNQNITVVSPSNWLCDYSKKSLVMSHRKNYVIPHPIDTDHIWKKHSSAAARTRFNLPQDKDLALFIAHKALSDQTKGWDMLQNAIGIYFENHADGAFELIIAGEDKPANFQYSHGKIHWMGQIKSDEIVSHLYAAADFILIPSKMEAFSLVCLEAQACGLPAISFDSGGPADIILHQQTGWLAKPRDAADFANGIHWILSRKPDWEKISVYTRNRVIERFSEAVISEMYHKVYQEIKIR